MIIFFNLPGERRGDVLRRAMAAGVITLPVRDFTCGGRVRLEFKS